ncbi:hypothetical protein H312_00996 [Anncaliia algerae PRA339]|uniref:Transcription factor CBF/NF-Y/archaeal histone domain-containing protein n=1 Tax=Anncaliia algerae PRA339 TaxID=1288291 RepID=A0A059F2T0_9MICR|nr:hypothetical protein H312_00996 [Anncaliia algerae PRA339]
MKKNYNNFFFANSAMRSLVKSINEDINVQKGVDDFLSKCSVLSVSFLATIVKNSKKKNIQSDEESIFKSVLEGIGYKE